MLKWKHISCNGHLCALSKLQEAWSVHLLTACESIKPTSHRWNILVCRSLFSPNGGDQIPILKTAAAVLTRSYEAFHGRSLGIIAFAAWGLGPLLRACRILFLQKNDNSWAKSKEHQVMTSYIQPLLLGGGAVLICRAVRLSTSLEYTTWSVRDGDYDKFQDDSEQDGVAGAVKLFALALERVERKINSTTSKQSAAILLSFSENIHSLLKDGQSQSIVDSQVPDLLILKRTKESIETRDIIFHGATIYANALMHVGTTVDTFLRENMDWLSKATNWAKFGATTGLGVIHSGHLKQGRLVMVSYLPQNGSGGGSRYSEGGEYKIPETRHIQCISSSKSYSVTDLLSKSTIAQHLPSRIGKQCRESETVTCIDISWEDLNSQIEIGKSRISWIISDLHNIKEVLIKLPASNRAELQPFILANCKFLDVGTGLPLGGSVLGGISGTDLLVSALGLTQPKAGRGIVLPSVPMFFDME
ncbi:26S proteasome non-ATPase regulatory subunit 1 homolog A-like protein [Tanacetum coccineum]